MQTQVVSSFYGRSLRRPQQTGYLLAPRLGDPGWRRGKRRA